MGQRLDVALPVWHSSALRSAAHCPFMRYRIAPAEVFSIAPRFILSLLCAGEVPWVLPEGSLIAAPRSQALPCSDVRLKLPSAYPDHSSSHCCLLMFSCTARI